MIVGVDPGLDGGIARLGESIDIQPMPVMPTGKGSRRMYDLHRIHQLLAGADLVVIEAQHAFPRDSKSGAFKCGEGFGMLQGLLTGLGVPYEIVQPKTWQGHYGISGDTKKQAAVVAKQLFPGTDFTKSDRAVKDHDGKIDAVLIAEYGRRRCTSEIHSTDESSVTEVESATNLS